MPISDEQLAANRANAAKSTGPRTPEGKALYAQRGGIIEPLWAQLFARFGRALNYRGDMADTELHLWAAAHNILKAGISWPTNIVNMRTPAIFEDLIVRRGAAEERAQFRLAWLGWRRR